ncbi:MAG: energy transducer TonB [Longimicrobiales bacterium]
MRNPVSCPILALALLLGACGGSDAPLTLPEPISRTSPVKYPTDLWDLGIEGETMLMVRITERGVVDSAYVLEPSNHAQFDSAAVQGALRLQFVPGRRGDRPVPLWSRLPIRFQRDSLEADAPSPAGPDSTESGT